MTKDLPKRVFLDENIYCLKKHLELLEVDVDVLPIELRGMSDPEAFHYAQKDNRIFITINGKHFIVLIPPRTNEGHCGLIWIKFQFNRTLAPYVAKAIHNFLVNLEEGDNKVFEMKRDNNNKNIIILEKKDTERKMIFIEPINT